MCFDLPGPGYGVAIGKSGSQPSLGIGEHEAGSHLDVDIDDGFDDGRSAEGLDGSHVLIPKS
ncbi:MAG: hypothetical protein MUE46_01905 [Xanthomonadales bacterium]|nr:hypothetical protein [Xanthomonadales bacterium]